MGCRWARRRNNDRVCPNTADVVRVRPRMPDGEEGEETRTAKFRNFNFLNSNRLDGCMWPASFCGSSSGLGQRIQCPKTPELENMSAQFPKFEWVAMDDIMVQLNSQNHLEKMTTIREENEDEEDSDGDVDLPVDLGKGPNVRRLQRSEIWSVTLLNVEWVAMHDVVLERQSFD